MISKILKSLGLQPRISKVFSRSLEQFFLTLGPKKIPVFENNSQLYKFLRFEVALTSEVIGILAKCLLRQMQSHANRSVQCEWTTLAVWQVTTYLSRWANNGWLETLSKKIGLMLAKEFVMEGFWPAERGLCFQKFLLLSHMPRTVLAFAYAYCILSAVNRFQKPIYLKTFLKMCS